MKDPIKLFVTDCDGVLTDGGYFISDLGHVQKKFNTHDFVGMFRLYRHGVAIACMSACPSQCIVHKFRHAGDYAHVRTDCTDKKMECENLMEHLDVPTWKMVAAIGDETNDAEMLMQAGYPACPEDACTAIKSIVRANPNGMVLSRKGGNCCVREFADCLIQKGLLPMKTPV